MNEYSVIARIEIEETMSKYETENADSRLRDIGKSSAKVLVTKNNRKSNILFQL